MQNNSNNTYWIPLQFVQTNVQKVVHTYCGPWFKNDCQSWKIIKLCLRENCRRTREFDTKLLQLMQFLFSWSFASRLISRSILSSSLIRDPILPGSKAWNYRCILNVYNIEPNIYIGFNLLFTMCWKITNLLGQEFCCWILNG